MKDFLKMCIYNIFCKTYILLLGHKDKRNMKYKISLCLIFILFAYLCMIYFD